MQFKYLFFDGVTAFDLAAAKRPRNLELFTTLVFWTIGEHLAIGEMLARIDLDMRFNGEKDRREIFVLPASTTCFCAPGDGVWPRLVDGDRWAKADVDPAVASTGLAVGSV